MKAWVWTYLLFLRYMAKIALWSVILGTLIVLLARTLLVIVAGPDMRELGLIAAAMVFFACSVASNSVVGFNLSWMQVVPMSKRQLIKLFCALQVTGTVLGALAAAFVGTVGIYGFSRGPAFAATPSVTHAVASTSMPGITVICILLVGLNVILFYFLKAPMGQIFQRYAQSAQLYQSNLSQRQKMKRILYFMAFLVVAGLTNRFWSAPFGAAIVVLFMTMFGLSFSWSRVLSLGRKNSRRGYALCLGFAALETMAVFAGAWRVRNDADFNLRAETIEFLGPFAGRLDGSEVARLLEESHQGEHEVRALGETYLTTFNDGKRIDARNGAITLEKALASKRSPASAMATYRLFDPATMGMKEVRSVLSSITRLSEGFKFYRGVDEELYLGLIQAALTPEEVIELLTSKDETENFYALTRLRYDRRAQYLPALVGQLPLYSDKVTLYTLKTLSVLTGRRITLEEWQQVRTGKMKPGFYDPDCSQVLLARIVGKSDDVAQWHVCWRARTDRADLTALKWIEAQDWPSKN